MSWSKETDKKEIPTVKMRDDGIHKKAETRVMKVEYSQVRFKRQKKRKTVATEECKVKGRNSEWQGPEHLYGVKRNHTMSRKT